MNAVEITVTLIVSAVLGVLVLSIILDWDIGESVRGLQSFFGERQGFSSVGTDKFPAEVLTFLERCRAQDGNMSLSLHLTGTGLYNKSAFFAMVKDAQVCGSLQSATEGCGTRETFTSFPVLQLPSLVRISCFNATLKVEAS